MLGMFVLPLYSTGQKITEQAYLSDIRLFQMVVNYMLSTNVFLSLLPIIVYNNVGR